MGKRGSKTAAMRIIERRDVQKRSIETIILDAYREAGGNQAKAAEIVGVDDSTLVRWRKQLGMERVTRVRRRGRPRKEEAVV